MKRGAPNVSRFVAVRIGTVVGMLLLSGILCVLHWSVAGADELSSRSIQLSDATPGAVATYTATFTIPNPETLGSIALQFCTNSPLFSDPCTAPPGFNASNAVLTSQSGATGFSVSGATTAYYIVLTRSPSSASGVVSYTFTGITNPSSDATFYGRLETFSSSDASGAANDSGGMALSTSSQLQISTYVPPYLLFCLGISITNYDCSTADGNYINYGNFTSSSTSSAATQMVAATNAANGYTITVDGSTMTSGNDIIPSLATADLSRPGVGQFGINLVANTTPLVGENPQGPGSATATSGYAQPDWFRYVPGDSVATASSADAFRKFTTSYVVNIPKSQPIGVYVTTLTYVCLANF